MLETTASPASSGKNENHTEFLKALEGMGDLGRTLALSYEKALRDYPKLLEVDLEVATSKKYSELKETGGFSTHKEEVGASRHRVVISSESNEKYYEELIKTRKVLIEIVAKLFDVSPEKLTPKMLASFVFLHELGHGYSNLTSTRGFEANKEERLNEMHTLPVSGMPPSMLINLLKEGNGHLDKFFESNKEKFLKDGYKTQQELMDAQERAYRQLSTERFPDNFAAGIIKKNFKELFPDYTNE